MFLGDRCCFSGSKAMGLQSRCSSKGPKAYESNLRKTLSTLVKSLSLKSLSLQLRCQVRLNAQAPHYCHSGLAAPVFRGMPVSQYTLCSCEPKDVIQCCLAPTGTAADGSCRGLKTPNRASFPSQILYTGRCSWAASFGALCRASWFLCKVLIFEQLMLRAAVLRFRRSCILANQSVRTTKVESHFAWGDPHLCFRAACISGWHGHTCGAVWAQAASMDWRQQCARPRGG